MRRDWSHPLHLVSIMLLFSTLSYGQAWSGILASSRAINWENAGLPAAFPDGETTPNPWTPATRPACTSAQAGITVPVASSTSLSSLNTAVANCSSANPGGSYLLLGSGTFSYSGNINLANNVTLRGSGPMSTTISFSGADLIVYGNCCLSLGGGVLSSSPAAGTTSVTIPSTTGTPTVGNLAWFNQCDTGYSGSFTTSNPYNTCSTGAYSDNGGIFVCSFSSACTINSTGTISAHGQTQVVLITSVTNNGGGSYTVGFSPGLYMPNWSTSNTVAMYWQSASENGYGMGVEDLTVEWASGNDGKIYLSDCYACWLKGVRLIGNVATELIYVNLAKNSLVANGYFFPQSPPSNFASTVGSQAISNGNDSDDLYINNICDTGMCVYALGSDEGDVYAYNTALNGESSGNQPMMFQHDSGGAGTVFILNEGNQSNALLDDDTWGTHDFDTFFRDYLSCWNSPFSSSTGVGILIGSFARFDNAIANVLGDASTVGSTKCTNYQNTAGNTNAEFGFNEGNSDPLALSSSMRWANCDAVNGTCRYVSSEVPALLSGDAAPYENSVPSSHNIPCSFFISGSAFTTSPCSVLSSGGSGLSWWKVCTAWTTFPTSCSTTKTQPFPPIGPDETGGPYVDGYAYDNAATLAYKSLPVDTSFQGSLAITASSWSSGTETLTVSSLPTTYHMIGGFQLFGVSSSCAPSSGASYTGRSDAEILMTGSSSTTISYALASSPDNGSSNHCTGGGSGTVKWPDVRQFDERVYQTDDPVDPPPAAPTGLAAVVQ